MAEEAGLATASGHPVRFALPAADRENYEQRVWRCGIVETRAENWHDCFNALIWLAFPRAKAALNALHLGEKLPAAAGRGPARDAATHFDECGLVVVCCDPKLLELVRDFRWKELFWQRRREVGECMHFLVFGHGTCERLLAPFRGLTAKALLFDVEPAWFDLSAAPRLLDVDRRLAALIKAGGLASPRDLQPVPLLGIPGVVEDNRAESYYDDTWQFRSGRRRFAAGASAVCEIRP